MEDELEEIPIEKITKDNLHCTLTMHTRYRSLLRLQSRTQFQGCYKFSRCASKAASPTIGDVKTLNKLARQLKSQPVKLQFWPLTGSLRLIGFPDVSYRNNEDGSSQRDMTVFYLNYENVPRRMECHTEVWLRKSEDQKDCALNNRGRTALFHEMFWIISVPPWTFDGLIRWSCTHSYEEWYEESCDNSKNNSRIWAKGNNPHDFHVVEGSLFRKYTRSCSHSNSELFDILFDEVIDEGRQVDHSCKNREILRCWRSSNFQDTHGAQGFLVNMMLNICVYKGGKCVLPERVK